MSHIFCWTQGIRFYRLAAVRVGGEYIDEKIIARIQAIIDGAPSAKRGALSRKICEELKWRSRNGTPSEVSCRKLLSRLHREGKLRLAEAEAFPGQRKRRAEPVRPEAVSMGVLKDFQPIELLAVGPADRQASGMWNDLMDRYHYLGSGPLCGAQLRYLVRSAKGEWIGALSFSAAAWNVRAREEWIGWGRQER